MKAVGQRNRLDAPCVASYSGANVKTFGNIVLSLLLTAAILAGIAFLFSATSVIESFQLYARDVEGGFALALIELVLGVLTAAAGGLLCFHRLQYGSWSWRKETGAYKSLR